MLNILERFDMHGAGFQTPLSIHLQAEAKRLAYEDRARYYADPNFSKIPTEWLVSKEYATQRAALIRPDRINPNVRPGQAPSRGDTTYFSVADKDGMMVSLIQSNFRGMGSGLVADGLGFMFQDRGQLFTLQAGHPNVYAPGKRPFQTIIPGFATRGGRPWMSFGVMGGDMQPQGQAQIMINMLEHGLSVQEAGDAPRWHHEGSSEQMGEDDKTIGGTGLLGLRRACPRRPRRRWPAWAGGSARATAASAAIRRWSGGRAGGSWSMRRRPTCARTGWRWLTNLVSTLVRQGGPNVLLRVESDTRVGG
jgi:gamma-glutamyltranspeptidase/glutathione hydrolase